MLDEIQEFVKEYHILSWGLIGLGASWFLTICFKRVWGTYRHKDKCKIIKGRSHRTALGDSINREIIKDHPSRPAWRKNDERETIKK